jgi:hypothetical protein
MMVLRLLFVLILMVETRGRPLESVAHALERTRGRDERDRLDSCRPARQG